MSSNFRQIHSQTAELAALERLKQSPQTYNYIWEKCCDHLSAFNFDWIFFKLAIYKDNNTSVDEFKFQPYLTTDYRVSCP